MTLQQMDKMTALEITAFEKARGIFDDRQSLEEYTTDIRDIIYLWKYIDDRRKSYTIEYVDELVKAEAAQIKSFYEEKEPAAYAAIDIDYCCG